MQLSTPQIFRFCVESFLYKMQPKLMIGKEELMEGLAIQMSIKESHNIQCSDTLSICNHHNLLNDKLVSFFSMSSMLELHIQRNLLLLKNFLLSNNMQWSMFVNLLNQKEKSTRI